MHSTYTDRIQIEYKLSQFKIKVDRSYKEIKNINEDFLTLRFVLHEISEASMNSLDVRRMGEDFEVSIEVNKESTLRSLKKRSSSYFMSE